MGLSSIVTDTVVLRPFRTDDAAALAREVVDDEIVRWMDIRLPYTLEDAAGFIAGTGEAWEDRNGAHFVITVPGDGSLRGYLGVLDVEDGMRVVEIGYWVARESRGRGLATAALQAALDWIPDAIGPERIELGMVEGNVASARIAENCGFVLRETIENALTIAGEPKSEHIYELPIVGSQ